MGVDGVPDARSGVVHLWRGAARWPRSSDGVIAENPSKFTYHGTGTYIVGERDVVVIDPGRSWTAIADALHAALEGCTVRAILVTHCHSDHSPLAAWLAAETGAPTIGFGPHEDDRVGHR